MASDRRTARGWYHGWNVVLVCVLCGFAANALTVNAFSLFLKEWSRDFHTEISHLQVGIAGMGLVCALTSPLVGILSDRFPQRFVIATGMLGLGVFSFAISEVPNARSYQLAYTFLGPIALTMGATLPANALVARWFVRNRGLALALTAVGLGLAGVIMPPVIAAIMPAFGWRRIWLAMALIALVILLPLALLVLRDRRPGDDTRYMEGDAGGVPMHGHGGGKSGLTVRDIVSRRTFWVLILTFIPMLALYGGGGQNLAPIATSRGVSPEVAGLFISLLSAVHVGAMLIGGVLSDRIGNRLPLGGIGLICAGGGALLATQSNPIMLAIGAACLGCGGAFWPLLASAVAVEYGAAGLGRAIGLMSLSLPLTGAAPFGIAKLQEISGSYAPGFFLLTAICATGATICLLFLREKRRPTEADMEAGTLAEPAVGSI